MLPMPAVDAADVAVHSLDRIGTGVDAVKIVNERFRLRENGRDDGAERVGPGELRTLISVHGIRSIDWSVCCAPAWAAHDDAVFGRNTVREHRRKVRHVRTFEGDVRALADQKRGA